MRTLLLLCILTISIQTFAFETTEVHSIVTEIREQYFTESSDLSDFNQSDLRSIQEKYPFINTVLIINEEGKFEINSSYRAASKKNAMFFKDVTGHRFMEKMHNLYMKRGIQKGMTAMITYNKQSEISSKEEKLVPIAFEGFVINDKKYVLGITLNLAK